MFSFVEYVEFEMVFVKRMVLRGFKDDLNASPKM